MAPGLGQPCFLTSSDPQVATHLRSISGEQATERRSSEGLSNVPGVGGEGHCQRMPPQRPPEVPTPPSGCPALRTQGPGLLPARAQPAGVPEAAEKLVLLLLLVVCGEATFGVCVYVGVCVCVRARAGLGEGRAVLPSEQLSKLRSPRSTLKATASSLWRLSASNCPAQSRSTVSCLQRRSPSSAERGGGASVRILDTQLRPPSHPILIR